VKLWISNLEYLHCRVLVGDTSREAPGDALEFYRRAGWGEAAIDNYRARFGGFGTHIYALPDSYRRLRDGDRLRIGDHEWRVVVGSGHSPEHACLHCPELSLLLSGDQVLPTISSNVSVFPTEPLADPLSDWLASIDALRTRLPGDLLVLPAHGEPFAGLHERLAQLAAGHVAGLARLREVLAEPRRAVDLFATLFKRQVHAHSALYGFATGETLAHLNHLVRAEQVEWAADARGVAWYRARRGPDAASSDATRPEPAEGR
jgi:glyoxylase-like metal-dependent hydrolase (beta-lactamase superfamily II)